MITTSGAIAVTTKDLPKISLTEYGVVVTLELPNISADLIRSLVNKPLKITLEEE